MGFPILVRWHLFIESAPSCWNQSHNLDQAVEIKDDPRVKSNFLISEYDLHCISQNWTMPGCALPSAGMLLTTKSGIILSKFLWLSLIWVSCLNIKTVFPGMGIALRDRLTGKTTSLYWDPPPQWFSELSTWSIWIFTKSINCFVATMSSHKLKDIDPKYSHAGLVSDNKLTSS